MGDITGPPRSLGAFLDDPDVIGVLRRDISVRLVDISRTGCLLESDFVVDVGTLGTLHLDIAGRDFQDAVRVGRCQVIPGAGDRYHVGVEFVWLDAPDDSSLRRLAGMLGHPVK
jgi:PilZ domain